MAGEARILDDPSRQGLASLANVCRGVMNRVPRNAQRVDPRRVVAALVGWCALLAPGVAARAEVGPTAPPGPSTEAPKPPPVPNANTSADVAPAKDVVKKAVPPARRAARATIPARERHSTFDDGAPYLNVLDNCNNDQHGAIDGHLEKLLEALGPKVSVRVLIATLPDPVDTSFGASFDASMSSLRAAFSTLGYASGSYYLPWTDAGAGGKAEKAEGEGPAGAKPEATPPASGLGACVPGILVFRKLSFAETSPLREVAIVLLVGETPAAGVAANALGQALEVAHRLNRDEPLLILGPEFSGSALSLRTTLDEWTASNAAAAAAAGTEIGTVDHPAPRFEIITGSASSPSVARALRREDTRFSATVVPDNVQMCALYRFLDERLGMPMDDVALLTESNTAFGAFFTNFGCQTASSDRVLRPRVTVPFPLHISDLRVAEERRRQGAARDAGKTSASVVDPLVDLDTSEKHERLDSLPAMRPQVAAVEAQLDLTEQFATLCRQGVRALGILASDVRDVTVLSAEAKRQCPRLLLFTLGPDRVMLHAKNSDLDGLVVASTYPLHASVSSWTYPYRGRDLVRTFPSEKAQGIFNAALLLLGDKRALLDYGPLCAWPATDAEGLRPEVWISAVGRGGFWPIGAFDYGSGDFGFVHRAFPTKLEGKPDPEANPAWAARGGPSPARFRFIQPAGFVFLLLAMQMFAWLNLVAFLLQSNPHGLPSRRTSAWGWLDLYRVASPSTSRRRAFAVVLAFGVLLLMNLGALLLYVIPGYLGGEGAMRLGAAFACATCGALIAAVLAIIAFHPVWIERGPDTQLRRRFIVALVGGTGLFGVILFGLLPRVAKVLRQLEPNLSLFFERTTNVTSRLSPASGAVLYGLCLYGAAIAELNRLRLLSFAEAFETQCFTLVSDPWLRRKLNAALRTGLRGWLFVVGLALAGMLAVCGDYHPPFEGAWMGDLFSRAGPSLVAAMIAFQLQRFVRTWNAMHRSFQKDLEQPDMPNFRKKLRPFFRRLLQRPLDPTLGPIIIKHVRDGLATSAGDPCGQEAVRLLVLASYGRAHLHNFLTFVTGAGFALILLSTTYPFKLLHSTDVLTWAVASTIVVVALFVLIAMNRDEVLSRIGGTTPGKMSLDRSFSRTVLIHVGLPLLGLAATRFSTVGVLFGDFVQPLMQLFGGLGGD